MPDKKSDDIGSPKDRIESLRHQVEDRVRDEEALYPDPAQNNGKIRSAFVRQCLRANELGDGLLYAALLRNRCLYNNFYHEWLWWTGHRWARDEMGYASAAVEEVVRRLFEEIDEVNKEITWNQEKKDTVRTAHLQSLKDTIHKRISRLRTDRGRTACLKFARTNQDPLAISGHELDVNPWLIACPNGVVDVRTGRFRDGRPDEYITKASPTEWQGIDAPAKAWEDFLLQIMDDDRETVDFIQRILGYAITGRPAEHCFLVLWGPKGRNGKSTFVETLNYVLGELAAPIQSEILLDQIRSRSAAAPSPDILALRGLRIAFASETDEGRKFSPARVKWLTGGDTLVGRQLNEKYLTRFNPTHTLILMTNNKPHAPADDFAFWERLFLIEFPLSFVPRDPVAAHERKRRQAVVDDLRKCAPGILAWLVKGAIGYLRRGLDPPEQILKARRQYQREEDLLAEWMEECCQVDEFARVRSSDLYDNFAAWFEKNVSSKNVIKPKIWGVLMGKRFDRSKSAGIVYYIGLDLKKNQGLFSSRGDGEDEGG